MTSYLGTGASDLRRAADALDSLDAAVAKLGIKPNGYSTSVTSYSTIRLSVQVETRDDVDQLASYLRLPAADGMVQKSGTLTVYERETPDLPVLGEPGGPVKIAVYCPVRDEVPA
jgi:hypothetical protein